MNDQLNEINRIIGRIEGKIDGILGHLEKINGRLDKQEENIDGLETFRDEIKGAEKHTIKIASVGGAITGGFVTAVIWIAAKLFQK